MVKINSKKAMELTINMVVMLIIGVILFGLGIGLFGRFADSGQEEIEDLNNRLRQNINALECSGDEWICVPSIKMQDGDTAYGQVFVVNRGEAAAEFGVEIKLTEAQDIEKDNCGAVTVKYLSDAVSIQPGKSTSIPFLVLANKVTNTPCSFVTSVGFKSNSPSSVVIGADETGANIQKTDFDNEKSALIVSVE